MCPVDTGYCSVTREVLEHFPPFAQMVMKRPKTQKGLDGSIKSLQATRDGVFSSASRFTAFGPACLSSGR